MFKTFKWLWDKAEAQGEQKILDRFYALRSYHQQQAEVAYLRSKYEPETTEHENLLEKFRLPKLTPKEHSAIVRIVGDLITVIERSREDKVSDGR